MLQLKNDTPLTAAFFASPDPSGVDTVFTVCKGTFALGPRLTFADEPLPVAFEDRYHGEPGKSSIRAPSDLSLEKPGTDVVLLGHAYAPDGRPVSWMDVSLAAGPVRRVVRVFGDRTWRLGAAGASPSPPAPFVTMPLIWERAFGGLDDAPDGPRGEGRNPVGVGFRAPDGARTLDGLPLPNLEDPAAPISSWKQVPPPACFAPTCAHWEPRRSYAGTYDAAWQQHRAPYLPDDFDARFFQFAPPGQVVDGHLQGGEWVDVRGASPNGLIRFQLPQLDVAVRYVVDGRSESRPARLDTLVIEPDAGRVVLVWRAALRCDKRVLRINEIEIELRG